ncbi:MAG: hypothetical protein K2N11_03720 [Mucispirillum sp.]|nr:hypothetical protein [Mucispirillum sp.]
MKKITNIIMPLFAVLLFAGCAEENENNSGNIIPPVVSEGLADNAILHDTPKIGTVSFKPASHITGNSFSWHIEDMTLSNANNREMTADFHNAGSYTVTLTVDGTEYSGSIIIPEEQSYEIDMGGGHTIISDKGQKRLFIYGDNSLGQLCIEKTILSLKEPRILKSYTAEISSVAAGKNHTLFTDNSNVYACGDNSYGQLGTGSSAEVENVTTVSNITADVSYRRIFVSAGGDMSVAGLEFLDGATPKISIYNWGYNDNAADKTQSQANLLINTNSRNEVLFATGNNFSVLRATSSYNVFSFGINDKWQLGRIQGATGYDAEPVNPDTHMDSNKTDMASGFVFTPYGEEQLAGDYSPRSYYQNNYFAKLAAGDDFVVSIKKETTDDSEWTSQDKYAVYVWGNNENNQLGFQNKDGNTSVRRGTALFNAIENSAMTKDPNKVTPIVKEMVEVAAGRAAGYAISSDGILYGWGDDSKGQLTNKKAQNTVNNMVYEIANPANLEAGYKKVWAGGDRVIVLAGDNNLYTWGDNTNGILGTNNENSVVNVPEKLYFSLAPIQ